MPKDRSRESANKLLPLQLPVVTRPTTAFHTFIEVEGTGLGMKTLALCQGRERFQAAEMMLDGVGALIEVNQLEIWQHRT